MKSITPFGKQLGIVAALLAGATVALAAGGDKAGVLTDKNGVAVSGYDVTAYQSGKALKGNKKFTADFGGATYHFASAENRDAFAASPEKFAPAYGGWCAYAMGLNGSKFEIDPKTFKVVDGKLLLFYNGSQGNTLPLWNEDEKKLHRQADANWAKLNR